MVNVVPPLSLIAVSICCVSVNHVTMAASSTSTDDGLGHFGGACYRCTSVIGHQVCVILVAGRKCLLHQSHVTKRQHFENVTYASENASAMSNLDYIDLDP